MLLSTCDGTCINDEKCLCVVDHGTTLAGKSMCDYGFPTCLLCQRHGGQSHTTIPESYPKSWVTSDFKINYKKEHYKRNGENSIVQETGDNDDIIKETWVNTLYYTSTEYVSKSNVEWKLAVCDCKYAIHAYIDVNRAIGVSNSYYDVMCDIVKCEYCHSPLKYIDSNDGIVTYNDNVYTKCRFCNTVVLFKEKEYIQTCSTCYEKCKHDDQKSRHICIYCKNSINVSQRKNIQEFKIRKTQTSRVETVYLCRLHRINHGNTSKVYKISELLDMF